ncbi:hypothetical protein [Streptomyces sp. TRM68367]|uniref:hypothetical protein n=1 Tax=Streptomyces sp. TRM68367 TaxID=2758415 RepID=UPI00165A8AEF|nr:hypothetical protein [Streptomyces sp. TRM68367]MBC9727539.1 hypothetical protein [Streptomyces sp. TRM68367]
MARTSRRGTHRSKKKRITLALAPVAALTVAVPLVNSAGAATPDDVAADCRADSDKLENCEFVPVQHRKNSLGSNKVVSEVTDNCGRDQPKETGFTVSGSVTRIVQTESGFTAGGDSKLANSVFEVGIKFSTTEFNIKRDDKKTGFSYSIDDVVKPDHVGVFMWSEKRTDVSGYLKATYKDEQDGQKVFFSPSKGATDIHVFYPQLLKNGTPDGRLWLRNVKCGTPAADKLLTKA